MQAYSSPVGKVLLGVHENRFCLCDWAGRARRLQVDRRLESVFSARMTFGRHPLITNARTQLEEYFSGDRQDFDLPLKTAGTPFQERVWQALAGIPYGEVRTYRQLAEDLGQAAAVRAVASANGANALSIVLPCHRVVGANGKLVGYAGGLEAKRQLLALEGARRIDLRG